MAPRENSFQPESTESATSPNIPSDPIIPLESDDLRPSIASDAPQASENEAASLPMAEGATSRTVESVSSVPDELSSAIQDNSPMTEAKSNELDRSTSGDHGALESAQSSGRLRSQTNNEQWRRLNSALYYASFIVQDARVFLAKYARQSDSQYPYYKEFDVHRILFVYLEGLNNVPSPRGKRQNAAIRLNSALNKLDVAWIGGDPRATLFAVPIPFGRPGSETTPQELSRKLKETLRNMKKTAEQLGYTVREESRTDPKHPHRNHIFMLVRTLSPTLEFPDTVVEGLDEEDPEEQDGDSFEYAS